MLIAVGSANQIKLHAVNEGFKQAGFEDIEVVGRDVPSDVPEQPFGEEQTLLGAQNRAHKIQEQFPEADFVIGIESGLMEDNHDMAILYCLDKKNTEYKAHSDKVEFPEKWVKETRARGFDKWTVGKVMKENEVVSDSKDPHLDLVGKSRTEYLIAAIKQLAQQIIDSQPSSTFRLN